jgi:hypothetical protein
MHPMPETLTRQCGPAVNTLGQSEKRQLRDLREKGENALKLVANETLYRIQTRSGRTQDLERELRPIGQPQ